MILKTSDEKGTIDINTTGMSSNQITAIADAVRSNRGILTIGAGFNSRAYLTVAPVNGNYNGTYINQIK